MLSILLPSYNNKCYAMVHELQRQCEEYFAHKTDKAARAEQATAAYEIIVADDGSRDQVCIIANYLINELPHCRYIRRRENVGRSAIRNYLVSEAKGDWVLVMDSDLEIVSNSFIRNYVEAIDMQNADTPHYSIIYGGVTVCSAHLPHNLRYLYEKDAEPHHTAEKRRQAPYQNFRTTNFVILRDVIAANPFDERIKSYGYEDVLFGKVMKERGEKILHIDNPAGLGEFESNENYIRKVEESIKTLKTFEKDMRGYSPLLHAFDTLKAYHLHWIVKLWHKLFGSMERRNLTGSKPSLKVLKMYKIGLMCNNSFPQTK